CATQIASCSTSQSGQDPPASPPCSWHWALSAPLPSPLLPFSENPIQFVVIMGYMILLVIAYTTTLCGSLTDSKTSIGLGLLLGIVAFILWLTLTIPSLLAFHKKSVNEFCLGQNCGESHWLVPRHWEDEAYADFPSPTTETSLVTTSNKNRYQEPIHAMINIQENSKRLKKTTPTPKNTKTEDIDNIFDDTTPNSPNNKTDTATDSNNEDTWTKGDETIFDDKTTLQNNTNSTRRHSISKRDLMKDLRSSRFPDGRFLQSTSAVVPLTHYISILLAFIYGFLHIFVLTTIFMNLSSFTCREGLCCPGFELDLIEKPQTEERECWDPQT
ncbi:hypothetical protein WDU94_011967, partial [Cyamophila willieti]